MRRGCIDWYIYGEWDAEQYIAKLRQYCPLLAVIHHGPAYLTFPSLSFVNVVFSGAVGCCFGAAWWVLIDAIVYSKSVLGGSFPWTYLIPGFAATLALVFMNLVSREELQELSDESELEEGSAMRARCWLFFSYMVAFGAVAGAVAVLIKSMDGGDSSRQHVGVAGLAETGLITFSGLLLWSFRTQSDDGYSLAY